ncbi:MAG: ABC transporter permease subunit [Candidatus Hermodarchaeota archaeon]
MSSTLVLENVEFKLSGKERQEPEKEWKFITTLLIPALCIFAFAILIPIIIGLYISFTDSTAATGYFGQHVTIVNYYELLSYGNYNTRNFWRYTYQTLFFTIVSLIIEFVLGLAFALILNKKFKGRGIARTTLLIPWAIPTVASATIYRYEIFNPAESFGLINSLLQLFGAQPVAFFGPDAPIMFNLIAPGPYGTNLETIPITLTMMVAITIDVWKTTPFITLLILAALQIVPEDLYKAGDIAGASGWQKFRYISWPLIKPGVGIALIFRAMEALRVYDAIVVFRDDSVHSLTWQAVQLWLNGDYGLASSISVILLMFVGIFAFFILLFTRRKDEKPKSGKRKSGLGKVLLLIWTPFWLLFIFLFKKKRPEIKDLEKKEVTESHPQIDAIKNLTLEQDDLLSTEPIALERKSITISKRKVQWYVATRYIKKILFATAVVVMCLFCAGPFIWIVLRSFRDPYNSVLQTSFELLPKYWSLNAYKLLFTNTQVYGTTFDIPLLNGFIISGLTVLVVIFAGVLIAYAIARFNFPFKRGLNGFIFSMNSLPPLIIVIPFYIQTTLIASFFPPVDLGNGYVNDMFNSLFKLILPYAAFNLPLAVFILVAFFKEIPADLWKAAKVDGASNFQVLRKVILPLTVPGIFTTAILVFIASWNELLFAQIFLIDPQIQTVPRTILRYVQNPLSLTADWNTDIVLLAATTISTIPLVIVVLFFQKKIISGLTRGAVKG